MNSLISKVDRTETWDSFTDRKQEADIYDESSDTNHNGECFLGRNSFSKWVKLINQRTFIANEETLSLICEV